MPPETPRKRHYLTRVPADGDRRKYYRRPTDLLVRILFLGQGIRQIATRTCRMIDISEGGAKIEVGPSSTIPDHFYLVLGEFDFFIGCSVVERQTIYLHTRFLADCSASFINKLSRLAPPDATLEKLGTEFEPFKKSGPAA
ncbi:PilZ domain-containing protein [Pararhizobium haloflavum]|uniref:PilZ domain-containing protein n=1 Tax=Pararhizobium haloflavum TaxID=2037914 RepID=UPI000C187225|nr:PilZ domain-containing protein [Pararhizobium haloflavum]